MLFYIYIYIFFLTISFFTFTLFTLFAAVLFAVLMNIQPCQWYAVLTLASLHTFKPQMMLRSRSCIALGSTNVYSGVVFISYLCLGALLHELLWDVLMLGVWLATCNSNSSLKAVALFDLCALLLYTHDSVLQSDLARILSSSHSLNVFVILPPPPQKLFKTRVVFCLTPEWHTVDLWELKGPICYT